MSWDALAAARYADLPHAPKALLLEVAYQKRDAYEDVYLLWKETERVLGVTDRQNVYRALAVLVERGYVEHNAEQQYAPTPDTDRHRPGETSPALWVRWTTTAEGEPMHVEQPTLDLGEMSDTAKSRRVSDTAKSRSRAADSRSRAAKSPDTPLTTSTASTARASDAPRPRRGRGAGASATRATDDPVAASAHRLTVIAFEQDPRPITAFPAVMARIREALDAGYGEHEIETVIRAESIVWTRAGLTTAFAKHRSANGRGKTNEAPGVTVARRYFANKGDR